MMLWWCLVLPDLGGLLQAWQAVAYQLNANFGNKVLLEHGQAYFIIYLSLAAFMQQCQCWAVAMATVWPAKPNYLLSGPF